MNRNSLPEKNMICETCGRAYRRCKKCAELKHGGIEAWREHCDSIECYQTLVFSQTEDLSTVTMEEYNRVIAFELPEGRKPVEAVQEKLDKIKDYLNEQEGIKALKRDNFGVESADITKSSTLINKVDPKTEVPTNNFSKYISTRNKDSWKQDKTRSSGHKLFSSKSEK